MRERGDREREGIRKGERQRKRGRRKKREKESACLCVTIALLREALENGLIVLRKGVHTDQTERAFREWSQNPC